MNTPRKFRIGVSACLLGELVRYDGKHKSNDLVTDLFAPYCDWVSVCPEVEMGFGVPREPIELIRSDSTGDVRLVSVEGRRDWTEELRGFATQRIVALERQNLDGYILKSRSPSCGIDDAVLRDANRRQIGKADGLWAAALKAQLPELPLVTEGGLEDVATRLGFIERIAFARATSLVEASKLREILRRRLPKLASDSSTHERMRQLAKPAPRVRIEEAIERLMPTERALLLRARRRFLVAR